MPVITSPTLTLTDPETRKLVAILEEIVEAQQQLLSVLQEEKGLIIDGKTDLLVKCAGEKELILRRMDQLENKRIQLLDPLSTRLRPLTLKRLVPLVSPQFRKQLETLRAHLDVLTTSISELNTMNKILIERVLGQISELFAVLQHITSDGETYRSSGKMHVASPGRTISRG